MGLVRQLLQVFTKPKAPIAQAFSLVIDEVFEIKSRGVVVLGIISKGQVHVGDELKLSGRANRRFVRVADIEIRAEGALRSIQEAAAGQQICLLLAGVVKGEIESGDQLTGTGVTGP